MERDGERVAFVVTCIFGCMDERAIVQMRKADAINGSFPLEKMKSKE